ncbi:hypothetical protein VSP10_17510 [Myroides odoratimimus]|uniref:hypothetical protein n=1 Tax=Myroides odoratimimus TaxID=76832 RepID=UPI002DBDAD42|nr:hypothetical protein [Myroides odoratimimus]MEC4054569.1 hypothetical protein [Myroides odoratimimus]
MIEEIYKHCIVNDRYGYTLPYLYKLELVSGREKTIEEILLFLSNYNESKHIISYCNDLDEFIIGLHKREYAPIEMFESFGNLHYDQDVLGKFDNIHDLILFFKNKYDKLIKNKKYSKNIDSKIWE